MSKVIAFQRAMRNAPTEAPPAPAIALAVELRAKAARMMGRADALSQRPEIILIQRHRDHICEEMNRDAAGLLLAAFRIEEAAGER